jgi:hypothetical protein
MHSVSVLKQVRGILRMRTHTEVYMFPLKISKLYFSIFWQAFVIDVMKKITNGLHICLVENGR